MNNGISPIDHFALFILHFAFLALPLLAFAASPNILFIIRDVHAYQSVSAYDRDQGSRKGAKPPRKTWNTGLH
jgi:hypothetical protein